MQSEVFTLCNLLLASSSTQKNTFLQPFLLLEQNVLLSQVRIIESCSKIYCHCHTSYTKNYERLHGVLVLFTKSTNFVTNCHSNAPSSKGGYFNTMVLLGPLNLPFQVDRTRVFPCEDISFALHQVHRVKPAVGEHREGVDLCLSTAEILYIPCKTPSPGHAC